MSVPSILSSLADQVGTVLGVNWSEMNYAYSLEENSFRKNDNKYGVGVAEGSSVLGTNKSITKDFTFFIILIKSFVNRSKDLNQREMMEDIYLNIEEIDKAVFQKKLNDANVLLVSDIGYEIPVVIDKSTISVRVNYTIKFRNLTT
jgi:hypothetical protein